MIDGHINVHVLRSRNIKPTGMISWRDILYANVKRQVEILLLEIL